MKSYLLLKEKTKNGAFGNLLIMKLKAANFISYEYNTMYIRFFHSVESECIIHISQPVYSKS